jgi:hypothetical protein
MHLTQILYLLTLPGIIILSYWLVRLYLRKLDKKLTEDGEDT